MGGLLKHSKKYVVAGMSFKDGTELKRDSTNTLLGTAYARGEVIDDWDKVPIGSRVSLRYRECSNSYEWLSEQSQYEDKVYLQWLGKGSFATQKTNFFFRCDGEVIGISFDHPKLNSFIFEEFRSHERRYTLRSFNVEANSPSSESEEIIFLGSEVRFIFPDGNDYLLNEMTKVEMELVLNPDSKEISAYVKGSLEACYEE